MKQIAFAYGLDHHDWPSAENCCFDRQPRYLELVTLADDLWDNFITHNYAKSVSDVTLDKRRFELKFDDFTLEIRHQHSDLCQRFEHEATYVVIKEDEQQRLWLEVAVCEATRISGLFSSFYLLAEILRHEKSEEVIGKKILPLMKALEDVEWQEFPGII